MEELLKMLIPAGAGIVGTVLGGFLTQRTQKSLLNKQLEREEFKEKTVEKKETLEIYNRILKIDGEHLLIVNVGKPNLEFDLNVYKEKIRPVIYEKYHLLNKDIASIVAGMDEVIKMCNYYNEITDKDHDSLNRYYLDLIKKIKDQIVKFRNNEIA